MSIGFSSRKEMISEKNVSFLGPFLRIFGLSSKLFTQVCHNNIQSVQRKTLRELVLEKNVNFRFSENFAVGFSELHPACPGYYLQKNFLLFWKSKTLMLCSGFRAKKYLLDFEKKSESFV